MFKKASIFFIFFITIPLHAQSDSYSYYDFLKTYIHITTYKNVLYLISKQGEQEIENARQRVKEKNSIEQNLCLNIKSDLFNALRSDQKTVYQLTQEFVIPLKKCKELEIKQKKS